MRNGARRGPVLSARYSPGNLLVSDRRSPAAHRPVGRLWSGRGMRARWLRVYRHSLTRFAAFGLLGLGIDVTLLGILLRLTSIDGPVAVTIAFAVTYVINFFLNRAFSFAAHGAVAGQLARFLP